MYKADEVEKKVLKYLKEKPKTVKETTKIINRTIRTTHYHINNLERKGKIECIKKWRKVGGNIPNLWNLKY